jgi:hypothetical protein
VLHNSSVTVTEACLSVIVFRHWGLVIKLWQTFYNACHTCMLLLIGRTFNGGPLKFYMNSHEHHLYDVKVLLAFIVICFFKDRDGYIFVVVTLIHVWTTFSCQDYRISHRIDVCGFRKTASTAHVSRISITVLSKLFPKQVIYHFGDVPTCTSISDLFCWECLKVKCVVVG